MRALALACLAAALGCAHSHSLVELPLPDGRMVTVENTRTSFLRQGHAANETTLGLDGTLRNVQLVCDQQISGNATLASVAGATIAGGVVAGPPGAMAGAAGSAVAAAADAYFEDEDVSHEPGRCPAFEPAVVPVVGPAEPPGP